VGTVMKMQGLLAGPREFLVKRKAVKLESKEWEKKLARDMRDVVETHGERIAKIKKNKTRASEQMDLLNGDLTALAGENFPTIGDANRVVECKQVATIYRNWAEKKKYADVVIRCNNVISKSDRLLKRWRTGKRFER
jgi:hypothetical protein